MKSDRRDELSPANDSLMFVKDAFATWAEDIFRDKLLGSLLLTLKLTSAYG